MTQAIPTTIRHARTGLDLIVNGALRQIESQFADVNSPECRVAGNELYANLQEELEGWAPWEQDKPKS